MIVTTKQLYKVAYGKFAVGAYNVNNMVSSIAKRTPGGSHRD